MTTRFPDMDPDEAGIVLTFDFSKEVASVSGPTVTCEVLWSDDAAPIGDVRVGAPEVSSTNAAHVLQAVTGGTDWTDYALRARATGPNGEVLVIPAVLPVRRKPK